MYWADQILNKIDKSKKHRIDDMKTPSGHAHSGSLRAISTHGLIYEAMIKNGFDAEFTYICLLYTSPSPRDATLSRMPSSA